MKNEEVNYFMTDILTYFIFLKHLNQTKSDMEMWLQNILKEKFLKSVLFIKKRKKRLI